MDAELRKRLEEAADKYIKIITPDDIPYYHKDVEQGFKAGAEYGYKEAIAQAKEWMIEKQKNLIAKLEDISEEDTRHFVLYQRYFYLSILLADFEADVNKLWEEKK